MTDSVNLVLQYSVFSDYRQFTSFGERCLSSQLIPVLIVFRTVPQIIFTELLPVMKINGLKICYNTFTVINILSGITCIKKCGSMLVYAILFK